MKKYKGLTEYWDELWSLYDPCKNDNEIIAATNKYLSAFKPEIYFPIEYLHNYIKKILNLKFEIESKNISKFLLKSLPFLKLKNKYDDDINNNGLSIYGYYERNRDKLTLGTSPADELIFGYLLDMLYWTDAHYKKEFEKEGLDGYFQNNPATVKLALFLLKNRDCREFLINCFNRLPNYMLIKLIYDETIELRYIKELIDYQNSIPETTNYLYNLFQKKFSYQDIKYHVAENYNGGKNKEKIKRYRNKKKIK